MNSVINFVELENRVISATYRNLMIGAKVVLVDNTSGVQLPDPVARITSPVPVGSLIRTGATLVSVETVTDGSLQIVVDFVVEREGAEKPCCIAQGLYRFYV